MEDGRLGIRNNRAERNIKPFIIERKNFLLVNTPKGTTGSASMFSLSHTAIENKLDSYTYLAWLMKTAKGVDAIDTGQGVDTLETKTVWTIYGHTPG